MKAKKNSANKINTYIYKFSTLITICTHSRSLYHAFPSKGYTLHIASKHAKAQFKYTSITYVICTHIHIRKTFTFKIHNNSTK